MMHIRHMRVPVSCRGMSVRVAVLPCRHVLVQVLMVPVIVSMGVLVLQCFVCMFMVMGLGQVQHHATQHQP